MWLTTSLLVFTHLAIVSHAETSLTVKRYDGNAAFPALKTYCGNYTVTDSDNVYNNTDLTVSVEDCSLLLQFLRKNPCIFEFKNPGDGTNFELGKTLWEPLVGVGTCVFSAYPVVGNWQYAL